MKRGVQVKRHLAFVEVGSALVRGGVRAFVHDAHLS